MGNKDSKILHSEQVEKFHFSSQHEKININNSLRNFENHQCSRPWSKISRRRWKNSTLIHPYQSCKTVWPVSQLESYFLPEFEVKNHHKDNNNNNNFIEQLPELNKGAFGTIFKVKNLDTNELFALKVISKSKIIENHLVEQVKEEVEIQRACGHFTFIAKCSSNWQSKNHLYIAIEYIGGGELRDLLINLGKLPVEIVKLYVAQIALAIDFLHNAGVIYRDLKPENLLLDADNANIKLIDFGLSKWLPYNCRTRTVCGTTNFMAPEILKLQPYNHSVDWWSLGILTCYMLTLKFPSLNFDDADDSNNAIIIFPEDHEENFEIKDLLLKLLEVKPEKRLRSLRTLNKIAFFKGFNFDDVKRKKLNAKHLLIKYYGENYHNKKINSTDYFNNFDENILTSS